MTNDDPTLLEMIEAIAASASEEGLSLRALLGELDEQAFGAGLFLLALPCCIPVLYGVPQVVALPMLALAAQMVMGREEPWLPARLADRNGWAGSSGLCARASAF